MPYQTEERLKSYLDGNQPHREQMCLALLGVDRRFTEVTPRHPKGGRDGGRDIEGVFRGRYKAYGAVGFLNTANDSNEQKKQIKGKFKEDLMSALNNTPRPDAFFFMTNVSLSIGEKTELVEKAKKSGIVECEIFDRERLRVILDSVDGFAIRFQYLGIALTEPEQATFFGRWGDDIQSVMTTGFASIQSTLDQLLFLQESQDSLVGFTAILKLDREYTGEELGHLRAYCQIYLQEAPLNTICLLFGTTDRWHRDERDTEQMTPSGVANGLCLSQWRQLMPDDETIPEHVDIPFEKSSSGSQVGISKTKSIALTYHTNHFIRLEPDFKLKHLQDGLFLFLTNKTLAQRIVSIDIYANGYKLSEIEKHQISIDENDVKSATPLEFTSAELEDSWVIIRPKSASAFSMDFSSRVPVRMFKSLPAGVKPPDSKKTMD